MSSQAIYFDNHATTQLDPRVLEAMLPFFGASFGNASSVDTSRGSDGRKAVEDARSLIARSIGADAREVIFTSGATEANNLAVLGGMRHLKRKGKTHFITAETEHKCVLESAKQLELEGFSVTRLKVHKGGHIDLGELENSLKPETGLVSLMAANNEIGVLHHLAGISEIVHKAGALLHTDAAQALGKIPVNVRELGVDFMSLSAHKAYGPMGVGALYLRHKPRARVEPLFRGGGQERGLRSGTLPTPLAVGFGAACEIISSELEQEIQRVSVLRNRIKNETPNVQINGDWERRIPNNLSLSFPHLPRAELLAALEGFDVSSGSACSDASVTPSYVLSALGLDEQTAKSSIRICIGRFTTDEEVSALVERLNLIQRMAV